MSNLKPYFDNIANGINSVKTCPDLKKLDGKIRQELDDMKKDIVAQIASLTDDITPEPTDPVSTATYLGKLVIKVKKQIATLEDNVTAVEDGLAAITTAIDNKAKSLGCSQGQTPGA